MSAAHGQTAFVYKNAGNMAHWPDFLLGVHRVEFPDPTANKIYVKPLDHAGDINTSYKFMRPLKVEVEWMYAELQGNDFEPEGKGWETSYTIFIVKLKSPFLKAKIFFFIYFILSFLPKKRNKNPARLNVVRAGSP